MTTVAFVIFGVILFLILSTVALNLIYPDKTHLPMSYRPCGGPGRKALSDKLVKKGQARWPMCGRALHDDWFMWPLTLIPRRWTWFAVQMPYKKWAGNAPDEWHEVQKGYPNYSPNAPRQFNNGKEWIFGATSGAGLNQWIVSSPANWIVPCFFSMQRRVGGYRVIFYMGLRPDNTVSQHRWGEMDGPEEGRPNNGDHAGDTGGYYPEISLSWRKL